MGALPRVNSLFQGRPDNTHTFTPGICPVRQSYLLPMSSSTGAVRVKGLAQGKAAPFTFTTHILSVRG